MVTVRNLNNAEEYKSFISEGNKVVKMSAEWCSPCRILGTTLRNLDSEKVDNIHFAEVDVDKEEFDDITKELAIRSIPVMVYFKDGKQIDKTVGLLQEKDIYDKLKELYQ